MSYLIFARKFRPQNFEEIIGQEPITVTLQNAIRQERIPQSFLFSGPRGVGKTSTARILAKSLNCEKGPSDKPCNQCISCKEITEGNSLDVLEIDGASNRGIDEIRNLRETVKFKPTHGRFKIYIIDEVHMLTTEAFNALLKTLEEPPEHVKFIFATTEPHKLPLTILSRCQRFNFKRITLAESVKKLEEIAKKEKIKFDANALFLIAKAAEGSLRDAESLLDQLATFSPDKIKEEDVLFMLGLTSEANYFAILTALYSKNVQKIFTLVRDIYEGGGDLVYFAKGLLELFRNLLLFQCAENAGEFAEVSESTAEEMKKHKNHFTQGELLLGISILQNLQGQLRRNLAPAKLLVETALLKLLHLDGLKPVRDMMAQPLQANEPASGPGFRHAAPPPVASPKISVKEKDTSFKSAKSAAVHPMPAKEEPLSSQATATKAMIMTVSEAESVWPRVIEYVKSKRMSTGIFLSESEPIEIDDHTVFLGLPVEFQFHKETLEKDANRRLVEEAFEVVSARKVRVQFVITKPTDEENGGASAASANKEENAKLPEIIEEAMNIFEGAKIIRKE